LPPLDEWLADARAILERLGAEPVVIGALAALRYRESPRATTDVDLLAKHVRGVREAFERDGYVIQEARDPGGEPFLLMAEKDDARIHIMVAETPYQREALRRAVDGFLTVEDVVIHKLIAWRERDQDDVRSILAAGHDLDESYISHWVEEWEVEARWDEARAWLG
jgi:hypothetical protein